VVARDKVTLYADGVERISWQPGGSNRLTGGRVGFMVKGSLAEFQELEQWDVGQVTKHYSVGGQRIALRRSGVLYYVHTDHLGSTSLVTDASGNQVAEQRYYPYGEVRWSNGELPTDRQFTGQRREIGLGLYDYGARRYDPALGRFIQADSIVPQPGNPQALNRYSYVLGNPLRYTDPTGHVFIEGTGGGGVVDYDGLVYSAPEPVIHTGASVGPAAYTEFGLAAWTPSPDDGVFLSYRVPGYFRPRIENVYYSAGGASPVVSGSIEHRHVKTLRGLLDWSVYEDYDEIAGSGALGPLGGEAVTNPKGPSVAPVLGIDRGLVLTLQPGQFMVGATNPIGPGGLRIGAEFRLTQNRFVVTSYGTLAGSGGASAFGRQSVHRDALLVSQVYFAGGNGVSGFDRAVGAARWSTVGPLTEVIP